MPVVAPVNAYPYDTAFSILNASRLRLSELKMPSLYPYRGSVLDATQASTQQAFNSAYRRFQDELADAGADRFYGDAIINGIPPVTNFDPAVLCWISWSGCFDGNGFFQTPALPPDLILPLWMSERPTGSYAPLPCHPDEPNMKMYTDGLPMWRKTIWNRCWEWREDAIYYPGSQCSMDFRVRYRLYLPDLIDSGPQRWYQQFVQIMRCQDPLSWWIACEFLIAESTRTDTPPQAAMQAASSAAAAEARAKAATDKWVNRDVMKNQRTEARRIPYGGGSRGQGGWGSGVM